jgi:hypothetical protein
MTASRARNARAEAEQRGVEEEATVEREIDDGSEPSPPFLQGMF